MSYSLWPHGLGRARLLCPWGFSRQEYWSGLPCPPPGDFPNQEIKPRSPTLQADSLLSEPSRKTSILVYPPYINMVIVLTLSSIKRPTFSALLVQWAVHQSHKRPKFDPIDTDSSDSCYKKKKTELCPKCSLFPGFTRFSNTMCIWKCFLLSSHSISHPTPT